MEENTANNELTGRERSIANLLPHQFKKGQSGNPSGRPAGKSLKDYTREMLAAMTDEERQEFLHGIPKIEIFKMAEGNPATATDLTSKGDKIVFMPQEMIEKYKLDATDTSPKTDSPIN